MRISKLIPFVALPLALGLGIVGQAQANVYAESGINIGSLTIDISPFAGAIITNFGFTATNTATLNGASTIQSANCGGTPGLPSSGANDCNATPPRLDPAPANAPGSFPLRSNNDFSFFGPGLNQYSNSDSVIRTAQLTGDGTTSLEQIAEAELQSGLSASANAEIQSTTGFIFNFSTTNTGSLALRFTADPSQMVLINEVLFGSFAQSNMRTTFTLTNNDTGGFVTWSPRGSAADDCFEIGISANCVETSDTQNLNRVMTLTTNGSIAESRTGWDTTFTTFGIDITGLTAGNYSLGLDTLTSVQLRRAVPEPGTLLLLGVGLAALAAGARKKFSA